MSKNYQPPASINPETVRLMGDAKKKEAEMLIRIDSIRFALKAMKPQKDLDNIIVAAAKIERFIEFGSVPQKIKK